MEESTRVIREYILEVLEKGYLVSLGTHDDGGVWVADVNYIYDNDLNIYWISVPHVRHSVAVAKNSNVAGAITVSSAGEENLGIQFSGTASLIEPDDELIARYFAKKNKPVDQNILEGRQWYRLQPNKIELIDQKLFGFHKQTLELSA